MDKKEQLEKLRNRVEGLSISRLPSNTKREFKELADAEFCSDYGMTLKYLVDYHKQNSLLDMVASKTLELEHRFNSMVSAPEQEQEKEVKTLLNGRKIETKVDKEEKKK